MKRKKKSKPDLRECYACGKQVRLFRYGETGPEKAGCTLTLFEPDEGDPIEVVVCARDSWRDHEPRKPCARKAREKAAICPGCGAGWETRQAGDSWDRWEPGEICRDCDSTLREARSREAAEKERRLRWYVLKPSVLEAYDAKDRWRRRQEGHEEAMAAAMSAFARTLGGNRVAVPGEDAGVGSWGGAITCERWTEWVEDGKRGRRRVEHRGARVVHGDAAYRYREDAAVELTDAQVDGVIEFCDAVWEAVQRAFREGAREGRSLLVSLARGEKTITEFEKQSDQYEEDDDEED